MVGLGNQWPSKVADWGLGGIVSAGVVSAIIWSVKLVQSHPWTAIGIGLGACCLAGMIFTLWRIVRGQPWLVWALVWEAWVPRRLDGWYLRKLVSHTHKMYFAFAAACDDSEMGKALDKMLWDWHGQANVLHKLFLAEDRSQGAASQIKAIEYVCVNRAEISRFFAKEPAEVLDRIVRDKLVAAEIKQFAQHWQQALGSESPHQLCSHQPSRAQSPS